jgi:hypothetical protein
MNRHWPLGALSLAASLLLGTTSFAAQSLLCEVRYASETRELRQSASADPYDAQTVEFDGRFRFKAVVLGTADHIEHITLTVHELGLGDAPVIIHQVRHQAPFHDGVEMPALTGWNHVYASYLGRELRYGCALQPVAPAVSKEAMP